MRNLLDHWLADGSADRDGRRGRADRARARRWRPACRRRCAPTSATSSTRLPDEDAEVLTAASVAGRDFSVDTLAAALERDRDDDRRPLRRAGAPDDADRARATAATGSGTTCTARCSTSCSPPTRARGSTPASGRTWRTPTARPRTTRPSSASTSWPAAIPSARCASCAWPRSARSARNAYPEGIRHLRAALDAADGLAAGSERTRVGGRAAVVARPGARGDRRLVGRRGRAGAAARARARGRLTDNEPLVSVLLALATLYELRGEIGRAQDMALECRRLAPSGGDERELESTRAARLQPLPPGLVRPRARVRRARRRAVRGRRARQLHDVPGDARRQRRRLLPRLGGAGAVVPRPAGRRARPRDPRARARARPEPRLQPRHRTGADGGRPPVPARAGGDARVGGGDDRRGAAAGLRLPRGDGPRAARLGARAARRAGAGDPRDHRRARRLARHRRADGRPALPRAARRGAPARRRDRRGARRGRRGARAVTARAVAVLRAGAAAARRARCSAGPATPAAAERRSGGTGAGARAGLRDAASCGSAPIWRGCGPTRSRPRRRAPTSATAYAGVPRGARHARPARGRGAARPLARSGDRRRRPRARARGRRARRGRRRRSPSCGGRASAAGRRSTRSRR